MLIMKSLTEILIEAQTDACDVKLKSDGTGTYVMTRNNEKLKYHVFVKKEGNMYRVEATSVKSDNTKYFKLNTLKNLSKHIEAEFFGKMKTISELGEDGETYTRKVIALPKALQKEREIK